MEQLTINSDYQAANKKVLLLIEEGASHKEAFAVVSDETGRSEAAIKTYFHRLGGNKKEIHGNCKLTKEEENQLTAMLIVFSMMHQAIRLKNIQEFVKKVFGKEVGHSWAGDFLCRHKDEVKQRQSKLLAKKRIDNSINKDVAAFILSMEGLQVLFEYNADNVGNYDETCVFVANKGGVVVKKAGKE